MAPRKPTHWIEVAFGAKNERPSGDRDVTGEFDRIDYSVVVETGAQSESVEMGDLSGRKVQPDRQSPVNFGHDDAASRGWKRPEKTAEKLYS